MATDVQVPALGESITEGTLAQWLKKPGEAVKADEPIASLETDKVSVEVPSPVAGVLTEQLVEEGDNVAVGAVIARIDQSASAGAAAAPTPAQSAAAATTNPAGAGETPALRGDEHAPVADAGDEDHITTLSPAVRRAVLEYHVDPTKIRGTGKDGRLTKDDVIAAAEAQTITPAKAGAQAPEAKTPAAEAKVPPPGPRPAPGNAGDRREERVRMSRLRQTIAKRLKDAQNTAAMLTTFNDVDMSAVIEARSRYKDLFEKKHGIRLGFMGFFVKACALAAKDVPSV
ncbi:MAG TPA: biotin/lipoyl-containing protein, partial [Sphingomicrobium sp.]|nr:biotin/lipoyl-containing protein [Sphingomicrobium sp.]